MVGELFAFAKIETRYPLDRNFGIPGPFGHCNRLPLQIFSDATTTLWG